MFNKFVIVLLVQVHSPMNRDVRMSMRQVLAASAHPIKPEDWCGMREAQACCSGTSPSQCFIYQRQG